MELTKKILIAMAIGVSLGAILQLTGLTESQFIQDYVVDGLIDSGGRIFVTLLKMMVVPLVFVSLVCGAANLGVTGRAGPLGGKTIGLYLVTTALAVTLALAFALIVDPGLDSNGDSGMNVQFDPYQAKEAPSVKDTLLNIFPSNPIAAMASGQMLQVIVFALFLGLALSGAGQSGQKIGDFFYRYESGAYAADNHDHSIHTLRSLFFDGEVRSDSWAGRNFKGARLLLHCCRRAPFTWVACLPASFKGYYWP